MMKAYVFYTESILECFNLISESAIPVEGLEIVPILGGTDSTGDLAGATHSHDYMRLMLSRWLMLPEIIKDNMGSNILFIDADIVFNKYKDDFVKNIDLFLQESDLVTQYDTNSGMSLSINMGFLGIKCNQENLGMFSKFMDIISSIENPSAGYPQIEFNDYLKFYNRYPTKFKVLPQDYGYLTTNCYFYHAVNCGGNQSKINAMKSALSGFKANK